MTMVTLSVLSRDDVRSCCASGMRGEAQKAYVSFASPALIWQVLTARRWEILQAMAGAGPMSIRGLAPNLGRNVKAIHADVTALQNNRVPAHEADGSILFPREGVHVDFRLMAA